jgi:hypothetical protein
VHFQKESFHPKLTNPRFAPEHALGVEINMKRVLLNLTDCAGFLKGLKCCRLAM